MPELRLPLIGCDVGQFPCSSGATDDSSSTAPVGATSSVAAAVGGVDGDGDGIGGTGRGGIGNGCDWYWTPAVSGVRAARNFHTAKPTPATAPASAPRRTILITRSFSHGDLPTPSVCRLRPVRAGANHKRSAERTEERIDTTQDRDRPAGAP